VVAPKKKKVALVLALNDKTYQTKLARKLRGNYNVKVVGNMKALWSELDKRTTYLIISDTKFAKGAVVGMEKQIREFCTQVVFLVYSKKERLSLSKRRNRRRAIDYILYEDSIYNLTEKVHKAARWAVFEVEVAGLSAKLELLARAVSKSVSDLNSRMESVN